MFQTCILLLIICININYAQYSNFVFNLWEYDIFDNETCYEMVEHIQTNNFVCFDLEHVRLISKERDDKVLNSQNYKYAMYLINKFYEKNNASINDLLDNYINFINKLSTRLFFLLDDIFIFSWIKQLNYFINIHKNDLMEILNYLIIDIFEPVEKFFLTNNQTTIMYNNYNLHFIPKNMVLNNCLTYYMSIENYNCISISKDNLLEQINNFIK